MKIIKPSEFKPGMRLDYKDLTPDELAEVYRLARAAFTAEDLQRYTEIEEGVSAEELLRELEETQKQYDERTE
jgi:hypothetical protein